METSAHIAALMTTYREEHPEWFRTIDEREVVDGLRVWDYNLDRGHVSFNATDPGEYWRGWFRVVLDGGGMSYMDGSRLWTRHPVSGEPA